MKSKVGCTQGEVGCVLLGAIFVVAAGIAGYFAYQHDVKLDQESTILFETSVDSKESIPMPSGDLKFKYCFHSGDSTYWTTVDVYSQIVPGKSYKLKSVRGVVREVIFDPQAVEKK